jgi:anti-sigma regulatory factor (Ser/Thr protein kinase)
LLVPLLASALSEIIVYRESRHKDVTETMEKAVEEAVKNAVQHARRAREVNES